MPVDSIVPRSEIWNVSQKALNATASQRVVTLAQYKKNDPRFAETLPLYELGSIGRESQIWHTSRSVPEASERVVTLAKPKQNHQPQDKHYDSYELGSCGRESQIWHVAPTALQARLSPRVESLAESKSLHPLHMKPKPVETVVSRNAKNASATPRVEELATYKPKRPVPALEMGAPEQPIRPVTVEARRAIATPRVVTLSAHRPFTVAEDFSRYFAVKPSALHGRASDRINEISQPRKVSLVMVTPREHAFTVNPTALKHVPSARLLEISKPVERPF